MYHFTIVPTLFSGTHTTLALPPCDYPHTNHIQYITPVYFIFLKPSLVQAVAITVIAQLVESAFSNNEWGSSSR